MDRVAVLGLGAMGSGTALSLMAAGHETTVWTRSGDAHAALREAGALIASDPAAAVSGADAVLSVLADGRATYLSATTKPREELR